MTQLYKIADEHRDAIEALGAMLEAGEIDRDSHDDTLSAFQADTEEKAANVALFIKNMRSDHEQLKAATAELAEKAKALQSRIEWYENYLETNLRKSGIESIKSTYAEVKFKNLPPIVEITGAIPAEFERVIPEKREPDKRKIAEALKAGNAVDGAELITGRTKLEIK
jgi:hypothetical protein